MASGAAAAAAPDGAVPLGDFDIYPDRPLAALRSGASLACEAARADGSEGGFYALICDPGALPRIEMVPQLRRIEAKNALIPLACAPVFWPPTGRRHHAVIYRAPRGGRLTASLDETPPPLGEEAAIRDVLARIVVPLGALHAAGLVHGTVNPRNLFFEDEGRTLLVLGECVSHRTAALQPALFSPLELAMADPGARGRGQPADDVFGLGMTLAYLLLGGSPAAGRAEEEVLLARIESGTYAALLNDKQSRLPPALIELLRGLLADDVRLRWTMAEVEDWLPSRHVVTRQGLAPRRATRPFVFAGTPYLSARGLALAFAADPAAAAAVIRGGDFEPWVLRALGDETATTLVKAELAGTPADARSASQDGALVARIGVALDPLAPIRYRGLAAMVDGLGGALLDAVTGKGGEVQLVAEAVARSVPQFWLSARPAPTPENVQLFNLYEQLRLLVDDRRPGGGVERLLYALNPTLHCLSPLIEAECVTGLGDVLPALERHADGDFAGGSPVDRHVAAFLATRLKSSSNDWMSDLASGDAGLRLAGTLRLLVSLQAYGGPASAPGIARWFARQAAPLIERLHHRPSRRHFAELAEKAARSGRLHDFLQIIDNPELRERDEEGFADAREAHRALATELARADAADGRREREIELLAGEMAAALATVLAGAGLLTSMIMLG